MFQPPLLFSPATRGRHGGGLERLERLKLLELMFSSCLLLSPGHRAREIGAPLRARAAEIFRIVGAVDVHLDLAAAGAGAVRRRFLFSTDRRQSERGKTAVMDARQFELLVGEVELVDADRAYRFLADHI